MCDLRTRFLHADLPAEINLQEVGRFSEHRKRRRTDSVPNPQFDFSEIVSGDGLNLALLTQRQFPGLIS